MNNNLRELIENSDALEIVYMEGREKEEYIDDLVDRVKVWALEMVGEPSEIRTAEAEGNEEKDFDYGYDIARKEILERIIK